MLEMIENQCSEKSLAAQLCGELSSMTQVITASVCHCVIAKSGFCRLKKLTNLFDDDG